MKTTNGKKENPANGCGLMSSHLQYIVHHVFTPISLFLAAAKVGLWLCRPVVQIAVITVRNANIGEGTILEMTLLQL